MMPLPKYNDNIATRLAKLYPSGASSTPQSWLMPKRTVSEEGSDLAARAPFITIDECIEAAQVLVQRLSRLGAQRHPLDVRRGVRVPVRNNAPSRTVKASSRTYFFDVRTAADGRRFLNITESRLRDKQRLQITVFPEEIREFVVALQELADMLPQR